MLSTGFFLNPTAINIICAVDGITSLSTKTDDWNFIIRQLFSDSY